MTEQTAPTHLLDIARTVLRDELLKEIPASKKYQALMVANAMAIAEREQRYGPINEISEAFARALSLTFLKRADAHIAIQDVIADLRARRLDNDRAIMDELHKILLEEVKKKLKISNPGYLTRGLSEK